MLSSNGSHRGVRVVFGHSDLSCPKQSVPVQEPQKDGDFVVVNKKKKGKAKTEAAHIEGVKLTKLKPNFVYRPKQNTTKKVDPSPAVSNVFSASTSTQPGIAVSNVFDVLASDDNTESSNRKKAPYDDEDDDIENVYDEMGEFMEKPEGASTPGIDVNNV